MRRKTMKPRPGYPRARLRELLALLAAAFLVMLALVRCAVHEDADEPGSPLRVAGAAPQAPQPAVRVVSPEPAPRLGTPPRTPPVLDGVDPCKPLDEPEVPDAFETKTVANITLAWRVDPDVDAERFGANTVGRIAAGILEDAAELTGTTPRAHLLIVIYPSAVDFRDATKAPVWAGGIYDGAVRLPRAPYDDLGMSLATLRHEIMHAQLHAALGCMPAWFNEGIATYFQGDPDIHHLLALLRDRDLYDVDALSVGSIQDLNARSPAKLYAQSLTMVMYALDHGRGDVASLVTSYRAAGEPTGVWKRWFPEARPPQLVEFLAHRMFGVGTGATLDGLLNGVVCCAYRRDPSKLACRAPGAPPPDGERTVWMDRTRSPPALCTRRY